MYYFCIIIITYLFFHSYLFLGIIFRYLAIFILQKFFDKLESMENSRNLVGENSLGVVARRPQRESCKTATDDFIGESFLR